MAKLTVESFTTAALKIDDRPILRLTCNIIEGVGLFIDIDLTRTQRDVEPHQLCAEMAALIQNAFDSMIWIWENPAQAAADGAITHEQSLRMVAFQASTPTH